MTRPRPRTVAIVPHTHWDREWYAPFQTFRMRLVDLLDEFLPLLERDMGYARFLLDGQMAVVDDYLAVRPEAEPVLRRLASSGRLAMGPWYILMDEFLVSGETIVRNLQLGLEGAAAFGGASPVGYLPDMFGHVAQMPQLLCQAGIEHAVVWRGVPAVIDKAAFWWRSPDGSTVRAEYLPVGYGNGAAIPDDAKALVRRVAAHDAELESFWLDSILFMNGTDHQLPQPWLGRVVTEANEIQDDYHFIVTSLAEYLASAPTADLPSWEGELRSGARANLLMGVTSNRVDVKQAAAVAERALEKRAEPLATLFMPEDRWPGAMLDLAWREVIRNSAHDSVCACSVDDVCAAVLHRYAEARHIADGVAHRALDALAGSMGAPGAVVVNPSARARDGVVELLLPGEGEVDGAQMLDARPPVLGDATITGRDLAGILGQIRSQQFGDAYINAVDVEESDGLLDIVLHADARLRTELLVEEIKRDLYARVGAAPDIQVRVRMIQPPTRRILTRMTGVPGFGWARWPGPGPLTDTVTVVGTSMSNGLVTVDVNTEDGTFAIDGRAGFDRLVDSGDHGDTYNYSPPAEDLIVDDPTSVRVSVLEAGPVRAQMQIVRSFEWPERIDDAARARVGSLPVEVTTVLELRAGERLVRVDTSFVNVCRDHRLRAWFPLPRPATSSTAECAFAVVCRGVTAEGGPTERGLPTFPSRRFVQAGGLTVLHEGLLEYELVDVGPQGATALALTLLRATGMLSRVEVAYRPLPAGPPIPMAGPEMLGPVSARYALYVGDDADPYALADDVFLPLEVVVADGGGSRPDAGSALALGGAEVSSVRRVDGAVEVRVFNPRPVPATVRLPGRSGWLVDLRGRPLADFEGEFALGPWQVATARLVP